MVVSEIRALDVLTSKFNLSHEDAREVVIELNAIDAKLSENIEGEFLKRQDVFLTKGDKVELIEKMDDQRVELVEKIERSRADMIKWMFIFWITQLVAMTGLFQFFSMRRD